MYIMNVKPLADNVLIEPAAHEDKTKSGIFLPESAKKERPEQGTVIAVGSGKRTASGKVIEMEVRVGDKVLFTQYGPNEIEIDGKNYLIAKQEDILAILE